jgi:hypothetical protein
MVVLEADLPALRFSVAASAGLIHHFLLFYKHELLKAKQTIELNKTFIYIDDGEITTPSSPPSRMWRHKQKQPISLSPIAKHSPANENHRSMIIFRD